ncbi:MAG: hypothetical protein ABH832_03065 [bacterium]
MLKQSDYVKIIVAVPIEHAQAVRDVLGNSGAGVQGNYKHCSGSYRSVGRFIPVVGAKPAIGQIGKAEEVEEEIIETICHVDLVEKVVKAVKEAHPYEEAPIDIIRRFEV